MDLVNASAAARRILQVVESEPRVFSFAADLHQRSSQPPPGHFVWHLTLWLQS
jgi:hypothetical protein